MSPLEIWCNEAQERYVLALSPGRLDEFSALCRRERCPFAVIGEATGDGQLVVDDSRSGTRAVDMPVADLLGRPPRMRRTPRVAAAAATASTAPASTRRKRCCACCGCRPSRTRDSSSRSATARSAASSAAIRWSVPGRCRSAMSRSRSPDCAAMPARRWRMGERPGIARAGRAGFRTHGDRRGRHQHRGRGRAPARRRQAVGELDGGLRRAGRGRRSLRYGARGRRGTVPGARHRDTGRQGFAVDAIALARCRRRSHGHRAAVARRIGFRAGRRRAAHADAGARPHGAGLRAAARRSRRRARPARRFLPRPGLRAHRRHGAGHRRSAPARRLLRRGARTGRRGTLLAYHDRSDGGIAITLLEMAFAGRAGFDVDLGATAQCDCGAIQRGGRRRAAGAERRRRARARGAGAPRPRRTQPPHRHGVAGPARPHRGAAAAR